MNDDLQEVTLWRLVATGLIGGINQGTIWEITEGPDAEADS